MFKTTNITVKRLYPMRQGPDCTYDLGEKSCRHDDFPNGIFEDGVFVARHMKRYLLRRVRQMLPFLP